MTDTTNTLASPTTRAELEEIRYGNDVVTRLLGAKIVGFGASAEGEILLAAVKDGERFELAIGKDPETGDVTIFEAEFDAQEPSA